MQVNASTYSKVEQTNKIQTVSMEDRKRFHGMFGTPLRVAPADQHQLPGAAPAAALRRDAVEHDDVLRRLASPVRADHL